MPKFKKVLLVEDDHITILVCKKIIKLTSFAEEVISAENGEQAFIYLESEKNKTESTLPEIILLDLNMPVMNGWEFLEYFKTLAASLAPVPAIYILSSSIDPDEKKRALSYPYVKGFISKPLTGENLSGID